ncbi:unnamed protein product, partial [Arabidopsis halleri]
PPRVSHLSNDWSSLRFIPSEPVVSPKSYGSLTSPSI